MKALISKRHPVGVSDSGPEAATKYRIKRRISRAHASSLRKVDRVARIHNGTAPLQHGVPTKREVIVLARAASVEARKEVAAKAALRARFQS